VEKEILVGPMSMNPKSSSVSRLIVPSGIAADSSRVISPGEQGSPPPSGFRSHKPIRDAAYVVTLSMTCLAASLPPQAAISF
jgi:hypothetical protein